MSGKITKEIFTDTTDMRMQQGVITKFVKSPDLTVVLNQFTGKEIQLER